MIQSVSKQKTLLRKAIRNVINSMSDREKFKQSELIQNYVNLNFDKLKNAHHIGIYLSQKELEIDTDLIIKNILTNYPLKKLYIPHVDTSARDNNDNNMLIMKFYQIENINEFNNHITISNNKYKLRQLDNIETKKEINPLDFDLIFVPGMAFSKNNLNGFYSRMGRGKGYYDRYLKLIKNDCHIVSLAFNEQILPNKYIDSNVPADELDICIHNVLYPSSLCLN